MTTPSFPGYAKILFNGYQERRESALLRSEMESGPAKQAKIKSRVMVTRTCNIYLASLGDYKLFVSWYANEISEGALWFTYQDPIAGNAIMARFMDGGLTATPLSDDVDSWQINAKIESWGA
jgi:hypothetical protein